MKKNTKYTAILSVVLAFFSPLVSQALEVWSGGYSAQQVNLNYKGVWTYVDGWFADGTGWYNPNDEPGHVDEEPGLSQSSVNSRWGSWPLAGATLNAEYSYQYCTQDCEQNSNYISFP